MHKVSPAVVGWKANTVEVSREVLGREGGMLASRYAADEGQPAPQVYSDMARWS